MKTQTKEISFWMIFNAKVEDYKELTKLRLTSFVVFSSLMSFLLASSAFISWKAVAILAIAGFLVTAAAGAINQIIEKDTDKLMSRTKDRPLAAGRMSVTEALCSAGIMAVLGIGLLTFYFNPLSGALGALSLLSYAFIYTPFKRISSASVIVGAFPGAMPLLIGWTAYTGTIGLEALVLFGIQFLWQLPHFWAIAWLADEDYRAAGFRLLPNGEEKSRSIALQNIPFLVLLIGVASIPYFLGLTGIISLIVATIAGLFFLQCGIQLAIDLKDKSARNLMFASFIYLPVVWIGFVLDKI